MTTTLLLIMGAVLLAFLVWAWLAGTPDIRCEVNDAHRPEDCQ